MDSTIKKRLIAFYVAGVLNGVLGIYVLIDGHTFLEPGTARTLIIVFLAFAILDFYFAYTIKKRGGAQAGLAARSGSGPAEER